MSENLFGSRVRKIRQQRGLTIHSVAEAAGMSYSGVQAMEQGRGNPRLLNAKKLAKALGVDVAELIDGCKLAQRTGGRPRTKEPKQRQSRPKNGLRARVLAIFTNRKPLDFVTVEGVAAILWADGFVCGGTTPHDARVAIEMAALAREGRIERVAHGLYAPLQTKEKTA